MIFPVNGTDIILLKLQNESCTLTSPQLPKEQSDWLSVNAKSEQWKQTETQASLTKYPWLVHILNLNTVQPTYELTSR